MALHEAVTIHVKPMTWEGVGGFFNGEAFLDARVREYEHYGYILRSLYTLVEVGQKDPKMLEEIEDYIYKETGFDGTIYPKPPIFMLSYRRAEACYEIAKRILPYLHLPERIRQAKNLIWITQKYAEMKAPEERERGRIKIAEMWERISKDYF